MAIEVTLPELGEGIETGEILDVLVSEGEIIAKNQAIIELETDKATVEVPSSHAGRVTNIHVSRGQSIATGAKILSMEPTSTSADAPSPAAPSAPAAAPSAPAPTPRASASAPTSPSPSREAPVQAPRPATPAPASPPPRTSVTGGNDVADQPLAKPVAATPRTTTASDTSFVPAGPAIRRLAREVGVDIAQVRGTGPDGRITREDVLAVVRQAHQSSRPAAQRKDVPPTPPMEEPEATSAITVSATTDAWGPVQIEPMTKIRKTIAAKMHDSWSTVPRVTNFDDADVTDLESIRNASKSDYAARGIKLTQMPFVIKAVAMALRTNPVINASIDEAHEQIIYKKYINIGIAIDTDRGLVVLSLRGADQLSIPEIARTLGTLAENARTNAFKLEDLRGNSFTISNLGAIGGTYSTPIVNIPEVAILLVGRTRKMPVVVEDETKIRHMMPLSLSYDHRLVDGAAAARFLNDVRAYLESPSRLLIAP